ncbi:MAG: HAD family phosphatase [Pirellulaceae bacterium]|nr:HAD family phosphatase [Planctomycetales bacterium]
MALAARPASQIRMVYFDLGNVLLDFDHAIASRQLGQLFGRTPDEMHQLVFESGLEHRYEKGEISTGEFHEFLCAETGCRPSLPDVCRAAADIFRLRADTPPIVAALKAAGMTTGILSNTCAAHWEFVYAGRYRILNDLFDRIVLSYEAKSMKPEPLIYEVAIAEANCEPHEIFFMDDRPENVAGARSAGIDAELFTSGAKLAADLRRRGVRLNY